MKIGSMVLVGTEYNSTYRHTYSAVNGTYVYSECLKASTGTVDCSGLNCRRISASVQCLLVELVGSR